MYSKERQEMSKKIEKWVIKKMVATQASSPYFLFYSVITGNIIGTSNSHALCRNVSLCSRACSRICTRSCIFSCSCRSLSGDFSFCFSMCVVSRSCSCRSFSGDFSVCFSMCVVSGLTITAGGKWINCSVCICGASTFRISLISCSCRSISSRLPKNHRWCAAIIFSCRPWDHRRWSSYPRTSFAYNASNTFSSSRWTACSPSKDCWSGIGIG